MPRPGQRSLCAIEHSGDRGARLSDGAGGPVQADGVRHLGPPAQGTGTAAFIHAAGHGHKSVRADCPGDMLMIKGEPTATWQPSGNIGDMIGQALRADHPQLSGVPALRT